MTPAEAAALLGICAGFDNRKPDATGEQARAWSIAFNSIRFVDARDAVVAHYQTSREWLMPFDIIEKVKQIRSKRIAEAPPLTPPAELDGNPERTNAWLATARRRIGDGEDPGAVQGIYGDLKPRHLPDLRELMAPETNPDQQEGA